MKKARKEYGKMGKDIETFLKDKDIFNIRIPELVQQFLKENTEYKETEVRSTFHKQVTQRKKGNNKIFQPIYDILELDISPKLKVKFIRETLEEAERIINEE